MPRRIHRRQGETSELLTMAVEEHGGDCTVLTPSGELDMSTSPRLDQTLRAAEERYRLVSETRGGLR